MIRRFVGFACLLLVGVGSARADFIQSVSINQSIGDSGTAPTGPENARLHDELTTFGSSSGVRTIGLTMDVFALQSPFSLRFITHRTLDPGTDTGPDALISAGSNVAQTVVYRFLVTVNNTLGSNFWAPTPVDPGSTGKEIGPFAIKYTGTNNVGSFFNLGSPAQTANPFPFAINDLGLNTTSSILFGGRSGGGGAIPFGASETFAFNVTVPNTVSGITSRQFSLTFTANPEPGSLAFAGLLGIPSLLGLRRRRNQATVLELPTAAV